MQNQLNQSSKNSKSRSLQVRKVTN